MEKIYMDMPQLIKLIRMQYVFHLLEQIPVPFFHKAYFTPIIRLKVLIPRNQGISVRYLFYILSFVGFDVKKSSVPNMNSNEVKQKVIPIPSLVEQQRIVSILDRFDTLTTDLTQGLPAEIEKRRQQYEYYRDKLLTFKRKGA